MLARFSDWNSFPVFGAPRSLPAASLRRELDRLFGDLERGVSFAAPAAPSVTFEDTGESYRLSTAVPGLTEKDIEISVTAKVVTLKAARQVAAPEGYTAHRRERQSFALSRKLELPTPIDPEKVEATLKQGLLTLTLPKVAETQPKKVTVAASA